MTRKYAIGQRLKRTDSLAALRNAVEKRFTGLRSVIEHLATD